MKRTELKQKTPLQAKTPLRARTSLKPKYVPRQSKKHKCKSKRQRVKKTESILHQKDGTCFLCMILNDDFHIHNCVEEHHVFFGTANRVKSEEFGLKAYLCRGHHRGDINGSKEAVHSNRENDLILKTIFQEQFEKLHSREEFMNEFGSSWL